MLGNIFKMIQDLGATSGQHNNIGGGVGATVGGLVGNIFGPIGHAVGNDLGGAIGNRTQRLTEGKDPFKELLGLFVTDPIFKPMEMQGMLPVDKWLGGPEKDKKKKDTNTIKF